jgi:hypothetical protein
VDALESRSGAPVEPSSPNQCQEEEDDTLSMAPGSQKASFLTVEEETVPTTSVSKKYVSCQAILNHLKSCGNMLRFRKKLVRRGKFLR